MNKFQQWATKRKPKPTKTEVTEPVTIEPTPEEELAEAWEDLKYEFRTTVLVFRCIGWFITVVVLFWAFSVVSIQNSCFLDGKCRVEIERVNK